jgi:hypothetical protein
MVEPGGMGGLQVTANHTPEATWPPRRTVLPCPRTAAASGRPSALPNARSHQDLKGDLDGKARESWCHPADCSE